jgi:putative proteasome-type protease
MKVRRHHGLVDVRRSNRRTVLLEPRQQKELPITFCLGINLEEGLVGIADTRITSGSECITARKVKVYQSPKASFFIMTSGLRSVRDKSLAYFDEAIEKSLASPGRSFDRLFKVLNCYAAQVRRVAEEDGEALEKAGLTFNIHALMGGQLAGDKEHKLYMLYPQGNWVEIGEGTPYQIIGAAAYGKPVLDRTLKHGDSLPFALKVGSLAFDSTRISAADVDFPVDVIMYRKGSFRMVEKRFSKQDMQENADWWQSRLRDSVNQLSSAWYDGLFEEERGGKGGASRATGRQPKPVKAPKKNARVASRRGRSG